MSSGGVCIAGFTMKPVHAVQYGTHFPLRLNLPETFVIDKITYQ